MCSNVILPETGKPCLLFLLFSICAIYYTLSPQGKLYEYKPKIEQSDPQMKKFVEMCFDPASPMNARLKETLLQILGEVKK